VDNTREPTCPIDRRMITSAQLQPVPRVVSNLLSRLKIRCSNARRACKATAKLAGYPFHWKECDFRGSQRATSDFSREGLNSKSVVSHDSNINVHIP
jgi:hypothetical protein